MKYKVSRVYATRMEWVVKASSEAEALAMMSEDEHTPMDQADESWLGPIDGVPDHELDDRVEPLSPEEEEH
jgi:hypothetical protein